MPKSISAKRFDSTEELISALSQLREDSRAMTLTDENFTAYRSQSFPVAYVEDASGKILTTAKLVQNTLSDGSHVYSIVLL